MMTTWLRPSCEPDIDAVDVPRDEEGKPDFSRWPGPMAERLWAYDEEVAKMLGVGGRTMRTLQYGVGCQVSFLPKKTYGKIRQMRVWPVGEQLRVFAVLRIAELMGQGLDRAASLVALCDTLTRPNCIGVASPWTRLAQRIGEVEKPSLSLHLADHRTLFIEGVAAEPGKIIPLGTVSRDGLELTEIRPEKTWGDASFAFDGPAYDAALDDFSGARSLLSVHLTGLAADFDALRAAHFAALAAGDNVVALPAA